MTVKKKRKTKAVSTPAIGKDERDYYFFFGEERDYYYKITLYD